MSRIIVSLTTSPSRIAHLHLVLDSILDAQRPPDAIYLNLPERYRNEEAYTLPDGLEDQPGLTLTRRATDPGPILKILPALEAENDPATIIVTIDDDVIYPFDMLTSLLGAMERHPDGACGSKGLDFTRKGRHIDPVRGDGIACHVLQGYGACAYRRSHFQLPALREALDSFPEAFRYSDDLILSNHLAQNGVSRYTVQLKTRLAHMPWGDDDPKALKYVDGGTHQRYFHMRKQLKKRDAWFID